MRSSPASRSRTSRPSNSSRVSVPIGSSSSPARTTRNSTVTMRPTSERRVPSAARTSRMTSSGAETRMARPCTSIVPSASHTAGRTLLRMSSTSSSGSKNVGPSRTVPNIGASSSNSAPAGVIVMLGRMKSVSRTVRSATSRTWSRCASFRWKRLSRVARPSSFSRASRPRISFSSSSTDSATAGVARITARSAAASRRIARLLPQGRGGPATKGASTTPNARRRALPSILAASRGGD
jgi:hypothetical protein